MQIADRRQIRHLEGPAEPARRGTTKKRPTCCFPSFYITSLGVSLGKGRKIKQNSFTKEYRKVLTKKAHRKVLQKDMSKSSGICQESRSGVKNTPTGLASYISFRFVWALGAP
jgi:hypothetical protein